MSEGSFKQKLMAQTLSRHPSKDSRTWSIRARTKVAGGYNNADTPINPKISPLEDREGRLHGQAVQTGDMKITVPGSVNIESGMTLIAVEGAEPDYYSVYYIHTEQYQGVATEHRCFVRPVNRSDT